MSPKPFGKPLTRFWDLPRLTRGIVIALAAAPVLWLILVAPARAYPTLAKAPLWWPSVVGFALLIAVGGALWLRHRPAPRPPDASSRTKIFLGRFFLSLLMGVPLGFVAAALYEPAFITVNGAFSIGSPRTIYAFVERREGLTTLNSPYWGADFSGVLHRAQHLPKETVKSTLTKLTLRRGALGALWIQDVEYEYLR